MNIPESEIIQMWQKQLVRPDLADTEGKPVQIIYPGRPNDGRGADFRDAVIFSGGERRQGCIEVHSKVSGWKSHGHHEDPVYNQVVLHVALEKDRPGRTILQNGQSVPTVILENTENERNKVLQCQRNGPKMDLVRTLRILEKFGHSRLSGKAARYLDELSYMEAGQSLYRGVCEALGYTKNKVPFMDLAGRVPLSLLEKIAGDQLNGNSLSLVRSQAQLLEAAGFLYTRQAERFLEPEYIIHLQNQFSNPHQSTTNGQAEDRQSGSEEAGKYPDWELFKVRPGNHPVLRTLALSYLVHRFRPKGLLRSFMDLITRVEVTKCRSVLEAALIVEARKSQGESFTGMRVAGSGTVLLGRERAAEIIINVILPFAGAWSRMAREFKMGMKVKEIYRHYPVLETNSIERHMLAQLSLSRREVNSALRQQGLVQIYKSLCTQGRCGECALGKIKDQ
jgi:hypothetical protein